MALISALCIYAIFLVYLFMPKSVSAGDNIGGDKTIGGLHFFEVHTPNGGTGIGVKIFIFLLIVGLILFCYYKWKHFKKRLNVVAGAGAMIASNPMPATATLAAAALNPRPVIQPALDYHSLGIPMSVLPSPVYYRDRDRDEYRREPRGLRRGCRDRSPDVEDARLP